MLNPTPRGWLALALLGALATTGSCLSRGADRGSATVGVARPPVSASVALARAGSVVIYGDSRSQPEVHRRVVSAIRQMQPAFVFHSGDLVSDGHSASDWRLFDQITGELRREAHFYPTVGNHEGNAREYFDHFVLPGNQHWYLVDAALAQFVVLDSGAGFRPGSEQRRWLEATLAQPRSKPVIALLHAGMFSTGAHGGDPTLVRDLLPILERGHVAAVFAGHDHQYERTVHAGIVHVVTGGGGAPLRNQAKYSPDSVKFRSVHHFCRLSQDGARIRVEVFTPELELIDSFHLDGGPGAPLPREAARDQARSEPGQ